MDGLAIPILVIIFLWACMSSYESVDKAEYDRGDFLPFQNAFILWILD
jgi:hypothetical protein